jgi:hypothetical protein
MHVTRYIFSFPFVAIPSAALATDAVGLQQSVQDTGVSAIWVLANISYAGMRAQKNPSTGWRVLSFIFGFPGTLLTYLAVSEGGERAYGIDVPKKR